MPIYDLICTNTNCKHAEERIYASNQAYIDAKRRCDHCRKGTLERQLPTFNIGNALSIPGETIDSKILIFHGHVVKPDEDGQPQDVGILNIYAVCKRHDPRCN